MNEYLKKEVKQMKQKALKVAAVVASVVATLLATSACWLFIHQPKEPTSLQNK
jgi:cyclic lactone autoinducer peptide